MGTADAYDVYGKGGDLIEGPLHGRFWICRISPSFLCIFHNTRAVFSVLSKGRAPWMTFFQSSPIIVIISVSLAKEARKSRQLFSEKKLEMEGCRKLTVVGSLQRQKWPWERGKREDSRQHKGQPREQSQLTAW